MANTSTGEYKIIVTINLKRNTSQISAKKNLGKFEK